MNSCFLSLIFVLLLSNLGVTHSASLNGFSLNLFNKKTLPSHVTYVIRGGAREEKATVEQVEDDDEDDVEDEIDLHETNRQSQILTAATDMWNKTPPITQIYVGSSIVISLLAMLLNNNQWPAFLDLEWKSVLTKFQLWRPISAFLFFGQFGLNYLLTIQFVWTYMAQLEKLNYGSPVDFFMMLIFGAVSLLTGYSATGLSTKYLGHNLTTFLVYIWARKFEGTDVNVIDLFVLKAELLPYFFCAQTLICEGEMPFADLLGIVVGHGYHYAKKNGFIELVTPIFVRSFFESEAIKRQYAKFKDDFE